MNREWLMMAAMFAGAVLFPIGGSGFKAARRFLMPLIFGCVAHRAGFAWFQVAALTYFMARALCLPYGDTTPWLWKCYVAIEYGMTTVPLGFTPWQVVLPAMFLLLFFMSNWRPTEHWVSWKIVEFLTGAYFGVCVASLIALKR